MFKYENGRFVVASLFHEFMTGPYEDYVLYTFGPKDLHDYKGTPGRTVTSISKAYLEMEDLTEFDFANKYFESYKHWETIAKSTAVRPYVLQLRKELELKLKAQALYRIKQDMDGGGPTAIQSAKFLATKGYVDKNETTRGRPSKEEIKKELDKLTQEEKMIIEELERIKPLQEKGLN